MAETDLEVNILAEIRSAEKKADELLQRAKAERDSILHEASSSASGFVSRRMEEIKNGHDRKISDYREKAKLIKEEKLAEGKDAIKAMKSKSDRNLQKAVEFVVKRFEEMV